MFGLETTVMLPMQWRGAFGAARPLLPSDIKAAIHAMPAPRWLMTTPLHLHACVRDGLDLTGGLAGIISSTMPLEEKLAKTAETLCGCAIEEIYGSTETGMVAMRRTASGPDWTLCEGLALVVEGQATRIQGGHVVPPFTLADSIEVRDARRFRLLGRAGDVVKVAGKRASLQALNARLRAVPGVEDGAFYFPPSGEGEGEGDGAGTGRPVAFAVAPDADAAAIVAALRRELDPVFLPRPLYVVETLPRADNGKITEEGLAGLLREARLGRRRSVSEQSA
jgi:acyl-coenzyme A synthetase/AMP-(fatty) acid ligase